MREVVMADDGLISFSCGHANDGGSRSPGGKPSSTKRGERVSERGRGEKPGEGGGQGGRGRGGEASPRPRDPGDQAGAASSRAEKREGAGRAPKTGEGAAEGPRRPKGAGERAAWGEGPRRNGAGVTRKTTARPGVGHGARHALRRGQGGSSACDE